MRSTLRTRGSHAFSVSYIIVSPEVFVDPIRIASWPRTKGYRHKKDRRCLAMQHGNNAARKVSEAKVQPTKGPGDCPGPCHLTQFNRLAPLDLGDLVGLGAAGGDDFHGRALLLADQRPRQRRGDG